ncbi:Hexaprenyldihydroxybenzoate methyltransferase, mitochondrial [Mortierella alpina]|uniref:Ubiquinone biosynthesis O-methyltransferase, mitochondrial n=1 Tax=Mortierella alpina TaxID=64518 RepID=A0A9P6M748_MORAP|nr:Hexaprenyldihydroxybenzoate methyltransferase, mitochondrial [Mortierella alpina]
MSLHIGRTGARISRISAAGTRTIHSSWIPKSGICHTPVPCAAQSAFQPHHRAATATTVTTARLFSTTHSTRHSNHSSTPHSSSSSSGSQTPGSTGAETPLCTVNQDEIAKFAAMSDEWWAPQGPFKMLHLMNPTRVRYIRNRLEASGTLASALNNAGVPTGADQDLTKSRGRFPLQGLRILDVGCGGGLLAEALARLGAQVTGLDASIENIQMARIHSKKDPLLNGGAPGSLEYRHQTAEQLVEQGQQFDVVCSLEVIEHVDNPAGFLRVLGELVKPNGDLILSTVSRTPISYFLTILCAEHLLRMVPVGTHHWSKFITPDELEAGVQDLAKCQVLNIQGLGFNPLSGQWELTQGRDGAQSESGGLFSLIGGPFAEGASYMLAATKKPMAG